MKKILTIMLFAAIGLLATTEMQAQKKQYYNLGWEIGVPVGSYADYIGETSLRGGFFSGNIFVTDAFSIGFKFGYNSYHENKDRATYYIGESLAITAASYNYIVTAPIQVGGYYHFDLGGTVEPYIGLGLGVSYMTQETLVQDFENYDYHWAFLLNPEIGLRFPIKNTPLALTVRAGYNLNTSSYTNFGTEYNNFQNINFGLALGWTVQ